MRCLNAQAMMLPSVDRVQSPNAFSFVSFLLLIGLLTAPAAASNKIIFDTDPGTDDALPLILALNSPLLDVRAITALPGNVTADMGLHNALRMLSFANRSDI